MLYSPSTKGFYHPNIHKKIPQDVIEISMEHAEYLVSAQSVGMEIIIDENNYPDVVPRTQSPDEIAQILINDLRRKLANSDFKVLPDYQSRSGKTDEEIAQIYSERAAWYAELQSLLNKENSNV